MADQRTNIEALIRQAADLACEELATRTTADPAGEEPAGEDQESDDARNAVVRQRLVELLAVRDSAEHRVRVSAADGTWSDHEDFQPRGQDGDR